MFMDGTRQNSVQDFKASIVVYSQWGIGLWRSKMTAWTFPVGDTWWQDYGNISGREQKVPAIPAASCQAK